MPSLTSQAPETSFVKVGANVMHFECSSNLKFRLKNMFDNRYDLAYLIILTKMFLVI